MKKKTTRKTAKKVKKLPPCRPVKPAKAKKTTARIKSAAKKTGKTIAKKTKRFIKDTGTSFRNLFKRSSRKKK